MSPRTEDRSTGSADLPVDAGVEATADISLTADPRAHSDLRANSVMDSLVQVSFLVTASLTRVASLHDLSLTQLRVLAILRDHEPKMAELAAHLGLEKSTVSGLIDRAARRGLVFRKAEPGDARAVRISLSAEGQQLARALGAEVARLVEPLLRELSTAEQQRLGALLMRILG